MSKNEVTSIAPPVRKWLCRKKLRELLSPDQWVTGNVYKKLGKPGDREKRNDFSDVTRKAYVDLCHPYNAYSTAGWFELRPDVEDLIRRHPSIGTDERIEDAVRGLQFDFLFSAPGSLIVIDGIRLPSR